MERVQEFGGYLPLEGYGKERYSEGKNWELLRMNAARYAIIEAYRDSGCKMLWVPVYTCKSVCVALEGQRMPYRTYNINQDFLPEDESIPDDECILITNYFGIHGGSFYSDTVKRYKNIIFDNTQSFFAPPVMEKGVYNVYSPRKFVGVSDGAYLIAESFSCRHPLPPDHSAGRAVFLMRAHEEGTNAAYGDYLSCEDDLTACGPRGMSPLTRRLLSNIDYAAVRERRRRNYSFLHERLAVYNELDIPTDGECPMVYPLLTERGGEELRAYLVRRHVYVPQWWKWVLEQPQADSWERKLSKYLYPLPVDQRYTVEDMEMLAGIVAQGISRADSQS